MPLVLARLLTVELMEVEAILSIYDNTLKSKFGTFTRILPKGRGPGAAEERCVWGLELKWEQVREVSIQTLLHRRNQSLLLQRQIAPWTRVLHDAGDGGVTNSGRGR